MARMIALATLVCIGAALLPGQVPKQSGNPHDRNEDEAVVKTIVDHWRQAWERFDASVLQEDYAEDADWLNAFGVRKSGSADIVAYVAQVVKRSDLQGRRTTWGEIRVRFVRGDIATAYRDYQTLGHKTPDGRELAERRTHAYWLLVKEAGKWRIASHIISDQI
jgi:uncharacterized protein (TIGR02246 family)